MIFADRVTRIKGSVTLAMTAKAAELRAKGVDVINLSVGEPDFPTPPHIIAAGKKAMDDGYTRYTAAPGLMLLREAVCTKLARDNDLVVNPEQIIVSNGAKQALYNALMALFQQGDEVIILSPYWVSYPEMVKLSHAEPVVVGSDPNSQFEPKFDELQAAINGKTKGIIINSPSNPTGGVWSREALQRVIDITRKHDLWLFSDECYESLSYDVPFITTASLAPDFEKILTFQSCSKTYAMTGWRTGYMAGPVELVNAMSKIQGQSTSSPNAIGQVAAIEALTGDQTVVGEMKEIFRKRRDIIVSGLGTIEGINCLMPGGAFYVFPDVTGLFGKQANGNVLSSPDDVTEYFLTEAHVVTVAGEGFGDHEHIRMSYSASEDNIEAAIDRIRAAVARLN